MSSLTTSENRIRWDGLALCRASRCRSLSTPVSWLSRETGTVGFVDQYRLLASPHHLERRPVSQAYDRSGHVVRYHGADGDVAPVSWRPRMSIRATRRCRGVLAATRHAGPTMQRQRAGFAGTPCPDAERQPVTTSGPLTDVPAVSERARRDELTVPVTVLGRLPQVTPPDDGPTDVLYAAQQRRLAD